MSAAREGGFTSFVCSICCVLSVPGIAYRNPGMLSKYACHGLVMNTASCLSPGYARLWLVLAARRRLSGARQAGHRVTQPFKVASTSPPTCVPSLSWQPPCPYLSQGDPIGGQIDAHHLYPSRSNTPFQSAHWLLFVYWFFISALPQRLKPKKLQKIATKYFDSKTEAQDRTWVLNQ